ncbi:MAG: sodium:proton antiporter [Candidatus Riflebacteria bacterium HGW-Riflebacteria-2]|nr:MAG: sodium:proton antiporter [Candidatus Riflebacteria bacterium HGW-Riflebacteria-2]
MSSPSRLCLFVLLFFCCSSQLPAQLQVSTPDFTLTGIKTTLSVSGLNEDNNEPVLYRVEIDGQAVLSGVSKESELKEIKVVFPNSGNPQITLKVGDQTASSSLRCIPGWLSILPPLVAIILALLSREVISSLFLGIWLGAGIIFNYNPFTGFLRALDKYLLNALADSGHAAIIIFSVCLGGMIGIINRTGGMQGIVDKISLKVRGPRSAQLSAWLMGVLIFFDDYANTLIVGNSMRPITDDNKISREKLSYIVDSTAAPVAGIAVLSTWIGYEIGLIRESYVLLGIAETNFYGVFLQTLPFRFYCLLALFFGFLIAITRRDFGPMLAAEQRAVHQGKVLADNAKPISSPEAAAPMLPAEMPKRWYNAAIPIAIVIIGTFIGLLGDGGMYAPHYHLTSGGTSKISDKAESWTIKSVSSDTKTAIVASQNCSFARINYDNATAWAGKAGAEAAIEIEQLEEGAAVYLELAPSTMTLAERARTAFAGADSTRVLIWVSVIGSIIALLLGLTQGLITLEVGLKAWTDGARTLVMAVMIMLLAWSINGICSDLGTANYIVEMVTDVIPYWLLPTIIFILACLISFSTGTSWGTMAILLPISIPLAYQLNLKHYEEAIAMLPNAPEAGLYVKEMILVSIGAVLEGSIFGDHCSPISDTTIMSSMASGSDHIDHVRTQAPYAALVGLVAILLCYIPAGLGYSSWLLLPLSMILLTAFVFGFGKKAEDPVLENSEDPEFSYNQNT